MAFIGLRHPVAAKFTQTADGVEPTYTNGMVIGRAIQANVTKNHNQNPLYADDIIAEDDNSLTAMSYTLGTDDLTDEVRAMLLGDVEHKTGDATDYFDETGDGSSPVGFGYIRVRRLKGVTSFQGVWCHKVLFTEDNEESQTKGESIEWRTPSLTGRVHGCYLDSTGKAYFRRRKSFTTEADAIAWLNGLAGIQG